MRDKFTARSILLRSQQQVETLLYLIPNLPLDSDKPLEVLVREQVKQRGLDQNSLYWLRLGDIEEQGWIEGRKFGKEIWHVYLCREVMPNEVELKDGSKVSKWVSCPDGSMTTISTTKLSKAAFAEYTGMVEAFGASIGVHFKARDYA